VLFILAPRTKQPGLEEMTPIGTGFLVTYSARAVPDLWFNYVVTARHVIEAEVTTYLRVTRREGGIASLPVPEWHAHPDADVAVAPIHIPAWVEHHRLVFDRSAIDRYTGDHELSLGERVYFSGLLADIPEMADRNVPMTRAGTVGAMYQGGVPIRRADKSVYKIMAHLIDCRSYAGHRGLRRGRWDNRDARQYRHRRLYAR
jgi:hypothetical protein